MSGPGLAGEGETEPIYSPSSPIHPEEFDMADHRKLDALDEKGFVILQPWEGEIDPSEWEGCDWDEGNIGKNWPKHRVTDWEIEEVFLNMPIAFGSDVTHSSTEDRYFALGRTNRGRPLFVAFTIRGRLIRPISARDMNARERRSYEAIEADPQIQG